MPGAVANGIGVAPAPLTSAAAVVLVLLAAPLLAYVVAALPRRMARRTEPAVLLRAD